MLTVIKISELFNLVTTQGETNIGELIANVLANAVNPSAKARKDSFSHKSLQTSSPSYGI